MLLKAVSLEIVHTASFGGCWSRCTGKLKRVKYTAATEAATTGEFT